MKIDLTEENNRQVVNVTKGSTQLNLDNAIAAAREARDTAEDHKDEATTQANSSANSAASSYASATNSASSATNSASSASSSANSASTATTKASEASASATSASGSATSAATSATTATTQASNASTSATNAATSESNAQTYATNAATSATNALASENAAELAETNAEAAETSAESAQTSAESAEASAIVAQTAAESAQTSATASANSATASATSAGLSATDAQSSEDDAETSAIAAASSATAASSSASSASTSAATATTQAGIATTRATEAATSATNAATSLSTFTGQYVSQATAPTSPIEGMLWFDTTNDLMKVYDGTLWGLAGSSVNGTSERQSYVATSGQTTFNATYDVGYVDVYLNGIKLVPTTDFTATNGTTVVLTSGATAGDDVEIVAYGTFELADTYTQAQADSLLGAKANVVDVPNGANSAITDNGTNVGIGTSSPTHNLDVQNQATFRGGITFNGDTSTANALDDYEEGTWTPTVDYGSATVARAYYTKIGNLVTVYATIANFTDISSSQTIKIGGIPFSATGGLAVGSAMWSYSGHNATTAYVGGDSKFAFYGTVSGGYDALSHIDLNSSSSAVHFMATYKTN